MLAATLSAGAQASKPDEAFARAVALQQAGDREGAAAAYRAFLKAQPTNVAARSNLGVVLAQLGRYEDAIGAYRAAGGRSEAEQNPAQPRHRALQGGPLRRRGDRAGRGARRRTGQPAGALSRGRLPPADGGAEDGDRAAGPDSAGPPGRSRAGLHARPGLPTGEGGRQGRHPDRSDPQARRVGGSAPDAGDGQARRPGSHRWTRGAGARRCP